MTRLALNKSTLHRQSKMLKSYQEFLPSLDLKRKQLIQEQSKARKELGRLETEYQSLRPTVAKRIPMLSHRAIDLKDLVKVEQVEVQEENRLGTRLPLLKEILIHTRDYAFLAKPQWVDHVAHYLERALQLNIEIQVAQRRLELLDHAVKIITQRVNLFEKVLIPRTRAHIKKIRIYLSDMERDAVVRAKIAKKKESASWA
jgi:V/A-type H+-transporting ATPase subunit D